MKNDRSGYVTRQELYLCLLGVLGILGLVLSATQSDAGLRYRVAVAGTLALQMVVCLFLEVRESLRKRADEAPNWRLQRPALRSSNPRRWTLPL